MHIGDATVSTERPACRGKLAVPPFVADQGERTGEGVVAQRVRRRGALGAVMRAGQPGSPRCSTRRIVCRAARQALADDELLPKVDGCGDGAGAHDGRAERIWP